MANKRFSQMVSNVGTDIHDTGTAFATIAKRYLNTRYFTILRALNWQVINPSYSFDTTASTQTQALPEDFGKELFALNTTTGKELARGSWADLVRDFPNSLNTSGEVERFCIYEDAVKEQPTSASVVTIVSSSASDTSQKVLIRGIVSDYETSEQITLTGTTGATGTLSFTRIKSISKDGDTTGKVTVTCNSQTIAVMPPKVNVSRYNIMFLHYNPTTAYTIKMPYIIKPLPLVEDDDYPVIDIADLIEIGAKADAWRYKKQFAKATDLEILFEKELQRYIWEQANNPNEIIQFVPKTFNRDSLY